MATQKTPLRYVRDALSDALSVDIGVDPQVYFGVRPLKPARRLVRHQVQGEIRRSLIDQDRDPYIVFYGVGNDAVRSFRGLALRTLAVRIDMRIAMADGEVEPFENAVAMDELEMMDRAVLKHLRQGGRLSSILSSVDDVVDDDRVRLRLIRTVMIRT